MKKGTLFCTFIFYQLSVQSLFAKQPASKSEISFSFIPMLTAATTPYKWIQNGEIQNNGGVKKAGFGINTSVNVSYSGFFSSLNFAYQTNSTYIQGLLRKESLLSQSDRQKMVSDTLIPFFYSKNWHILNTSISVGYVFSMKKVFLSLSSGIGFATLFTPQVDFTLNKIPPGGLTSDRIDKSIVVYSNSILPKANIVMSFLHQISVGYQLPKNISIVANISFSHTLKSKIYYGDTNNTNYWGTINNFGFGIGIQKSITLKTKKSR